MQKNLLEDDIQSTLKLRHSRISILSLAFCIFSVLPTIIGVFTNGLIIKTLSRLHVGYLTIIWLLVFLFIGMVLSIIDLIKPNRLKIISRISLIFSITIFVLLLFFIVVLYTSPGITD